MSSAASVEADLKWSFVRMACALQASTSSKGDEVMQSDQEAREEAFHV
jgi:hypothetical protein